MNHEDSDARMKEFRKCSVLLSNDILTTEQCETILALSMINNEQHDNNSIEHVLILNV